MIIHDPRILAHLTILLYMLDPQKNFQEITYLFFTILNIVMSTTAFTLTEPD